MDKARHILTYRYRLNPKKAQHAALTRILDQQRDLYNAALEERISAYKNSKKPISYFDQAKSVTEIRADDPAFASVPANIQRWTLKRLDDAYSAFFKRAKKKSEKAGFPRFRSKSRWKTFGFREFSAIRLKDNKLYCKAWGGGLRVNMHRAIPDIGSIKSCNFKKDGDIWYVGFQVALPLPEKKGIETAIGIDVGLTSLVTLSDGSKIENIRVTKKLSKEIRRRNRALSRSKRFSKRWKKRRAALAKAHRVAANTRNTYLHQVSAKLVETYDLVAMEQLNIKGMAKGLLAKSVHDAAWGKLLDYITYKAVGAGKYVMRADAKRTSQECSGCGEVVKKGLSDRWHDCPRCGLGLCRDVNAARNVISRAVVSPEFANIIRWDVLNWKYQSEMEISN